MDRIKFIKKMLGDIDEDKLNLLKSDFEKLNDENKNKLLDFKMELLANDLLVEEELYQLFEQLDLMERYSDMLVLIIQQPARISMHQFTTTLFISLRSAAIAASSC